MLVLITCVENPGFSARVSTSSISYSPVSHEFSLPRPIGDDWLQRINHIPATTPLISKTEGQTMFVVFEALEGAQKFQAWLIEAAAEQDHGYRTMRG